MEHSVWLLSLSGLLAPFTIFASGLLLTCYSIFIFLSIYYCVFSFICYGVSNDQQQINMAEDEYLSSEDRERSISEEERLRVERTVAKWVNKGGFKQSGITLQTVSKEINISRYHLTAWLKTTDQELFNPWLTFLRIEEAKRLLTEHPDWSNDTVAQACGFNSRSYFQNVFRKQTGLTPAQFASNTE
jgi:YesN/AraC family two-component response regulator